MSTRFWSHTGLIIVRALVHGPEGEAEARLALDTGAVTTTIRTDTLIRAGYDLSAPTERTRIVTGSGIETVPTIVITQMNALQQAQYHMPIHAYTLPAAANIDGLLGLDFLRDRTLTIDFPQGLLTLT